MPTRTSPKLLEQTGEHILLRSADKTRNLKIEPGRRPPMLHEFYGARVGVGPDGIPINTRWHLVTPQEGKRPTYRLLWQRAQDIGRLFRQFDEVEYSYQAGELPLLYEIEQKILVLYPLYQGAYDPERFMQESASCIEGALEEVVGKILGVEDPHKQVVRDRLLRVYREKVYDKLSRRNPQAYVWILNNILTHLTRRTDSIALIRIEHAARRAATLGYWAYQWSVFVRFLSYLQSEACPQIETLCNLQRKTETAINNLRDILDRVQNRIRALDVEPFSTVKALVTTHCELGKRRVRERSFGSVVKTMDDLHQILTVPLNDLERDRQKLETVYRLAKRYPCSEPNQRRCREIMEDLAAANPTEPWKWLATHAAIAVQQGMQCWKTGDRENAQKAFWLAIRRLILNPADLYRYP